MEPTGIQPEKESTESTEGILGATTASLGYSQLGVLSLGFLSLGSAQALASSEADLPPFVAEQGLLVVASVFFGLGVIHTFFTQQIMALAHRCRKDSMSQNVLHFLGEVEIVFGIWAFALVAVIASTQGTLQAVSYLNSVNFTEAVFVFVIMCMAATKPIIQVAGDVISLMARCLPFSPRMSFYVAALSLGPLMGSFITEPAAMTVVALLLKKKFYDFPMSLRFKYATLGLLFVNISIGGTLTHFAAPPVLMVAKVWGWDTSHMLSQFGWKSALAIAVGTLATALFFRSELSEQPHDSTSLPPVETSRVPLWLVGSHLAFMALCILYHAYIPFFVPLFLLFLGWTEVTNEYQEPLKIRESLLVGFFLGGLVVLGGLQGWWLQPVLTSLTETQLFIGATALTAVTDNAALTYLGTLVPTLSAAAKYALVAGAVAGGGLTVIANAPNPAGYGILREPFGQDGISPLWLFVAALPYTLLAMGALFFL